MSSKQYIMGIYLKQNMENIPVPDIVRENRRVYFPLNVKFQYLKMKVYIKN